MKLIPIQPKGLAEKFKSAPTAITKGMRAAADAVKKDLELTTKDWDHAVTFTIDAQADGSFLVGTSDKIWKWVDEGTPPHIIVAKRGKGLHFTVGGRAKTTPGRLTSSGGSKGGIVVIRPHVNHPGTKARDFTGLMAKRWRRGVAPFIRQALEEHFK